MDYAFDHPAGDVTTPTILAIIEQLLAIQTPSLTAALTAVSQIVAQTFRADKVDIFLYDPPSTSLIAMGTSDTPMGHQQHRLGLNRLPLANGGRTVDAYRTGDAYRSGQVASDMAELRGVREALGVRSCMLMPFASAADQRGVIQVDSATPDTFTDTDLRFLAIIGRWIGLIAQRLDTLAQREHTLTLEARQQAMELVIGTLAHDVGNHLAPLLGRLGLLRTRLGTAADALQVRNVRDIESALQSVQRLQRLITSLLDSSRMDQGIFHLQRQHVDLTILVRATVTMVCPSDRRMAITGPDAVLASVDPDRMQQVLENLLTNALKHGGPDATITIHVTRDDNAPDPWVRITIADTGPGIPADRLPMLFQRFVSGPNSRGLGLGLYLADQMVAAHGGRLSVVSVEGQGTTFTIAFPADDHPAPAIPPESTDRAQPDQR